MRIIKYMFLVLTLPLFVVAQQQKQLTIEYCSYDSTEINPKLIEPLGPLFINEEFEALIPVLKEIEACAELINNDFYTTAMESYIAYSYGMLDDLDNMKKHLQIFETKIEEREIETNAKKGLVIELNFLYGEYYRKQRRYERAAAYYQKDIDLMLEQIGVFDGKPMDLSKIGANFSYKTVDVFNNAALAYDYLGDLDKALQLYTIALELEKVNPYNAIQPYAKAILLQNLFRANVLNKDWENADKYHSLTSEALAKTQGSPTYDWTKNLLGKNKAIYLFEKGKLDEGETLAKEVINRSPRGDVAVFSYQTLAEILSKKGEFENALEAIKKADAIAKEYWKDDNRESAKIRMLHGNILKEKKQLDLAIKEYDAGLNILLSKPQNSECSCNDINFENLSAKRLALDILDSKAETLSFAGQHQGAIACYETLHQLLIELQNKYIISEESKYSLAGRSKKFYEDAIIASLEKGDFEKAYQFSQSARSMILLQQMQDRTARRSGIIPEEKLKEGEDIKININDLQKRKERALFENNSDMAQQLEKEIYEASELHDAWIEKLEQSHPQYYQLKYQQPDSDINRLKSHLSRQDIVLIEYFLGEKNLYTFQISSEGLDVKAQKTNDSFISSIKTFHTLVKKPSSQKSDFDQFNKYAFQLYNLLIKPVLPPTSGKRLIIIPDEQLNLIPFEALVTSNKSFDDEFAHYHELDYLGQSFDISYSYSSHLTHLKNKKASQKKLLGIAPSFNREGIQELPNNIREVESAASTYSDTESTLLTNKNATYEQVMHEIKNHRIVHFATHALFNDQLPLESRIELADTAVYIYEIVGLNHSLDAAIMSACETAAGQQRKGEGVISLARAFISSGCPDVTASLWSVSDQKTGMLMEFFHEALSKYENPTIALAKAKRKYMDETISKNMHPFYWAGFIHYTSLSDGASHARPGILHQWWWLILPVILLIVFIAFRKSKN